MRSTKKHTYTPGKDLRVSLIALLILVAMISAILAFGPEVEDTHVPSEETTASYSLTIEMKQNV